jgi:hypothetical protein
MKTLVLSGEDCDTDNLVDFALKMGMDGAKVMRENNLVSADEAECEEEIDQDANEMCWRDAAIDYLQDDLGVAIVDLKKWHGEQFGEVQVIQTQSLITHVNSALVKLNEAKKLLGEAL